MYRTVNDVSLFLKTLKRETVRDADKQAHDLAARLSKDLSIKKVNFALALVAFLLIDCLMVYSPSVFRTQCYR